jgi:hypothetical protein
LPLPGDANASGQGVVPNAAGDLVVQPPPAAAPVLWVSEDQAYFVGTAAKVGTSASAAAGINAQYREFARYLTVTCDSNEAASRTTHPGVGATMLGTCDGTSGCCSRAPAGQRTPVQLYHNRPSSVSVDLNGDVWIANRADDNFGSADPHDAEVHHQSSITKIAGDISRCVDRNGNGRIDTSSDVNGDGIINTDCNGDGIPDDLAGVAARPCVGGTQQEFFGLDDECVLFTTNTGPEGGIGRALALGTGSNLLASDAWAGRFADGQFYRVDGNTGLVKNVVRLQSAGAAVPHPSSAVVDQSGILWAPNIDSAALFYLDTSDANRGQGVVQPPPPAGLAVPGTFFGVALDGYRLLPGGPLQQQVWLGDFSGDHPGAWRYAPNRSSFPTLAQGAWTLFRFPAAAGSTLGVSADARPSASFVWLANGGSDSVGRIAIAASQNGDATQTPVVELAGPVVAMQQQGVTSTTVASNLDVWTINTASNTLTHVAVDAAGNPASPRAGDVVRLDDNGLTPGGVAHRAPFPSGSSDAAGFSARNFGPLGPFAVAYVLSKCAPAKTKWLRLTWSADTPPQTSLAVRVRAADDATALAAAAYGTAWTVSPADLTGPPPGSSTALSPNPSALLQVQFLFGTGDRAATPALHNYSVLYECTP